MTPFPSRPARVAAFAVRLSLGLFFVVSAVAKWADIDQFEVHVFSYGLLPLNASFLVARLIIVAEILVGVGLAANIWHKFVNASTVLMLACFTLFLGYAALAGRTDSCQCMGPLLEMSPLPSILKNAVLFMLLWVAMHAKAWKWKPKWWLWLPAVLAVPTTLFIVSAPDNWLFPQEEETYNAEALGKAIADDGALAATSLREGRHVVAFLTAGCPFCRMTDQKLASIWQRDRLDSAALIYLIPAKDSTTAPLTINNTAFRHPSYVINKETFVTITYGQRPMIMLIDRGEVKGSCHYRNIDESRIVQFLNPEQ